MKPKHPNVVRAFYDRPWAILEATYRTIEELIARDIAGESFSREEIEARIQGGPGSRDRSRVGGVAVLPVSGVITPRATLFTEISGGTSVENLRNSFLDAMDDRDVSAIVLDVDSPGGAVDLLPELAADMRAKRGTKPVVAVANTLMASAAYWIGSQADEVYASPSSEVGSIGVFGAHVDISELQAKAGIKTTLIHAGRYKVEGNPYEPLSDEARAHIQGLVDAAYDLFVADVAAGRQVDESKVRTDYGEGRVLEPKAALAVGLVDGIQSFEATVRNLMTTGAASSSSSPAPGPENGGAFSDDYDEALRVMGRVIGRAEALRVVSVRKREQLAELLERGANLLTHTKAAPELEPESDNGDLDLEVDSSLATAEARLRL